LQILIAGVSLAARDVFQGMTTPIGGAYLSDIIPGSRDAARPGRRGAPNRSNIEQL